MQTLEMKITIEVDDEANRKETREVEINRPATQNEVDEEIEKVEEEYKNQTIYINWNEEKLEIE